MFNQAKQPREERKARKQVSDKIHSALVCAEFSALGLSYNGVNMLNG